MWFDEMTDAGRQAEHEAMLAVMAQFAAEDAAAKQTNETNDQETNDQE